MRKTRFMQSLDLDLPIVLGPFGGGLSRVDLTAQVCAHGGLGSFGAHHLSPPQIVELTQELRARTSRRFAVNLWVSDHDEGGNDPAAEDFERLQRAFAPWFHELGLPEPSRPAQFHVPYDAQVEALLDACPPVFSFVFGIPSPAVLTACRARDIVTIGAATTIAEAQALEAAGVDAIVASGSEAGGHRPSFLAPAEESLCGSFALTRLLAHHVRVPVIAAGGIADACGVRAALALGAQAAQIGTAFLACDESGASDAHRDELFGPRAHNTVLTRAFSGRLARGLRNGWTDLHVDGERPIGPFPLQSWFTGQLRAAALAAGRIDLVSLWSGQIAPLLQHRDARSLLHALREELTSAPTDSFPRH